jgi:hypothetical protein
VCPPSSLSLTGSCGPHVGITFFLPPSPLFCMHASLLADSASPVHIPHRLATPCGICCHLFPPSPLMLAAFPPNLRHHSGCCRLPITPQCPCPSLSAYKSTPYAHRANCPIPHAPMCPPNLFSTCRHSLPPPSIAGARSGSSRILLVAAKAPHDQGDGHGVMELTFELHISIYEPSYFSTILQDVL